MRRDKILIKENNDVCKIRLGPDFEEHHKWITPFTIWIWAFKPPLWMKYITGFCLNVKMTARFWLVNEVIIPDFWILGLSNLSSLHQRISVQEKKKTRISVLGVAFSALLIDLDSSYWEI